MVYEDYQANILTLAMLCNHKTQETRLRSKGNYKRKTIYGKVTCDREVTGVRRPIKDDCYLSLLLTIDSSQV